MYASTATLGSPSMNRERSLKYDFSRGASPVIAPFSPSTQAAMSGSRKRGRSNATELHNFRHSSPVTDNQKFPSLDASYVSGFSTPGSPPPLTNTSYQLSNGLDTPCAELDAQYSWHGGRNSESDFRRRWSSGRPSGGSGTHQIFMVSGLEREQNGQRKRKRNMQTQGQPVGSESWGNFAFRMAGALAGAVWDFCRGTGFQGFQAGGGDAYTANGALSETHVGAGHDNPDQQDGTSTPVPGRYPVDGNDIEEQPSPSRAERPAKRLQTRQGGTDGGWVMVKPSQNHDTRQQSPQIFSTMTPASHSPQKSHIPRPSPNASSPAQRRARTSTPRRSFPPGSKPAGRASNGTSYSPITPRPSSTMSNRKSQTPARQRKSTNTSPASEDVQKYVAQREREEKRNDASMKRLNQQLQDMIRQGQDALASKYEVEGDFGFGNDSDAMSVSASENFDHSMSYNSRPTHSSHSRRTKSRA